MPSDPLPTTPKILRNWIGATIGVTTLALAVGTAMFIYKAFATNTLHPFITGLGVLWITFCVGCGFREYIINQWWD